MEASVCSQDVNVKLYFVIPAGLKENECSNIQICTYQACKENGFDTVWVSASEIYNLEPVKQDIFVCDPFEGEAFTYLSSKKFKSVILGPRCLLTCLHRKESVPDLPFPLHNTAMKGLIITSTGFQKEQKEEIQQKVERMAGIYSNVFHEGVTHLVADSVGSNKYKVATEREIPVMTGEWVNAVWEAVQRDDCEDIFATDQRFSIYTCAVFKGLIICVSQMNRKEKEAVKKIIEDNGGTYTPSLEMDRTSVLVIPAPEGEKYKHACNWRLPCLTPDWVYDSVEQGHALDRKNYQVSRKTRGRSTPVRETDSVLPDVSMCSTILNETSANNVSRINETVASEVSLLIKKPTTVENEKVLKGVAALDEVDLQKAMKSGLFLDGCKIYLSGFQGIHMEKLRRILNAGGATRFNQLTDSVSHVIIGKVISEHLNTIESWSTKPHIVTADWITESIKAGKALDEGPFLYLEEAENTLVQPVKAKATPNVTIGNNETYVDEAIMKQYTKDQQATPIRKRLSLNDSDVALPDSQASGAAGIFKGKLFTVSGYSREQYDEFVEVITAHEGEIVPVDYRGKVHYSLANIDCQCSSTVHPQAIEYISHLYLEDCTEKELLLPVEYYHMPHMLNGSQKPLDGCVIAATTYSGKTRTFLMALSLGLGACYQESFAKKDNPKKNIRCSTHLLCPVPEGDKYNAAIKWGIPAVTCSWLLQCAQSMERVSETDYRVDAQKQVEVDAKAVMRTLVERYLSSTTVRKEDINFDKAEHGHEEDSVLIAPTPVNKKIRAVYQQHVNISEIKTPDEETIRRMYPTPGRKRSSIDSLDGLPTPDTPYGQTWYPNPDARTRKAFKRMLDDLSDNDASEDDKEQQNTPMETYYKKFAANLREFNARKKVKEVTPTFDKENTENPSENKQVAADVHGPLTGVVTYVCKKIPETQQKSIYQTVTKLGGDYRWTYDHTVTHFIFQGRSNDTNREFRVAREDGKIIVSPEWVWMCRDENNKIDEELFPHTHNPKMTLSILSAKATPTSSRRGHKRKIGTNASTRKIEDTLGESEHVMQVDDTVEVPEEATQKGAEEEEEEKAALSKQLEELEALATVTGSGRKSSGKSWSKSMLERPRHTPTKPANIADPQDTCAESQNTAITWDDPQEREARMKLKGQLTRDTQEILELKEKENQKAMTSEYKENGNGVEDDPDMDVTQEYQDQEKEDPPRKPQKHIFILSGMTDNERIHYTKIIEDLGGEVSQAPAFDPLGTHIITAKPSRSEKHLGAIAAGKWILCPRYLQACIEEHKFVKEDEYEWGNPKSLGNNCWPEDSIEAKLSAAAYRWRVKLQQCANKHNERESGVGAFTDMKAVIYSSKGRIASLKRLIEAGGGEVLMTKPPYENITEITHCFVEQNIVEKIDLAVFASHGIPCIMPIYLNNYLVENPPPKKENSCIPEYMKVLANMSSAEYPKPVRTTTR
ncbi:mutagen-sensitive 101 isoform X2 [Oratosquilla oratoria]|uniref:mutagen-sensitive 101 isoform X2 n=1 Tax=Oratosquilla oratoria TaxID=337810 RepID=UPI003F75FF5F